MTIVEVVDVPDVDDRKVLKHSPETCTLCTCNIPTKVISLLQLSSYSKKLLYISAKF